jgi:two-component system, cell cycle sensor histidine kinase and response regulator CckA
MEILSKNKRQKGNGERILLVEDEEGVRNLFSKILVENNYQVEAAADAHTAIKLFDEAKMDFDLLLSDVVLPGPSGLELAEILRARKNNLAIIIASGYSDVKAGLALISGKNYKFIPKPFELIVLLHTIRQALEEVNIVAREDNHN